MKQNKNALALTLMISSIVLLLILQIFWLRSSYDKAFYDFRREANTAFRNTVFILRDSIFARSIEPIPSDSGNHFGSAKIETADSLKWKMSGRETSTVNFREHSSSVQVFVTSSSGEGDSVATMLKPLASRIQDMKGHRSFIIRLRPDSLNTDTLALAYSKALNKAGITVPFQIQSSSENSFGMNGPFDPAISIPRSIIRERRNELPNDERDRLSMFRDTLLTDFVGLNPMKRYHAVLTDVRSIVLREITPQIFFSLFLTLITITSFMLMHKSIRSQQRLAEIKNDFINNVTHELKTPVATVSVALEALKNFNVLDKPELTKEYLNIAQNELNRLTLMTDKILKTSVFESKGVDFIPEKVNLEIITEQVLSSLKLIFEKRQAKVSFTKTGVNFDLYGSEIHLTNVVFNLLDNALKYSVGNPKIDMALFEDGNQLQLVVSDQGIGIATHHQKKIFEKFFRVPSGNIHNTKGYGLGLSYVASVVKSHGGKIGVNSEPGKGSVFTIALPK